MFFRYSFSVHVTLLHHFSAPRWRSHGERINKLHSQPQAPASYCLASPFFWDPLWTRVRSLLLQPHCAHSCSHFLNQSGCSGRAQLHLSLCDQGTAGSLLWSAPCWSGKRWPISLAHCSSPEVHPLHHGSLALEVCQVLGFYGAESSPRGEPGVKVTCPVISLLLIP